MWLNSVRKWTEQTEQGKSCNILNVRWRLLYSNLGYNKINRDRPPDQTNSTLHVVYYGSLSAARTAWSRSPGSLPANIQTLQCSCHYPKRDWESAFKGNRSFDETVATNKNCCKRQTRWGRGSLSNKFGISNHAIARLRIHQGTLYIRNIARKFRITFNRNFDMGPLNCQLRKRGLSLSSCDGSLHHISIGDGALCCRASPTLITNIVSSVRQIRRFREKKIHAELLFCRKQSPLIHVGEIGARGDLQVTQSKKPRIVSHFAYNPKSNSVHA